MRTLLRDSTESPSPWFVTGFVTGEGSFTYHRNGSQLLLVFGVRLAKRDRIVLEALQNFFGGIGRIYMATAGTDEGSRSRAGCYYRINRPAELLKVVDHFDRYPLRGTKRRVYDIWREMVFIKAAHIGSPHPAELDELADKLSRTVPRNQP